MECSIWELASLLSLKKFSFLCEMNESSSEFRIPKTVDEEKASYLFYSEIYGLQEQMGFADFSRMTRPQSEQDLHH